jgi:SPX domain protein involved in polyphosphate accumulation
MQQQRFELKYLIDEAIALGIRDFASSYLELDDYAVGRENFSYPVHSVYLDSDDLRTHNATINGTKNRYKLRLRYYDDKPNTPVFFEVKARVDNCILKQRCGVKREAVPLLLGGQLPDMDHLFSKEPKQLAAIQRFNLLAQQIHATPKIHNTYLREAWVSTEDNSVRVTFDRQVLIEPHFHNSAIVEMKSPVQVFPEYTILELKFTTRYPNWFKDLVRNFNLMQWSSAKYSEGIVVLGEHCFVNDDKVLDYDEALLYSLRTQSYSTGAFASNED